MYQKDDPQSDLHQQREPYRQANHIKGTKYTGHHYLRPNQMINQFWNPSIPNWTPKLWKITEKNCLNFPSSFYFSTVSPIQFLFNKHSLLFFRCYCQFSDSYFFQYFSSNISYFFLFFFYPSIWGIFVVGGFIPFVWKGKFKISSKYLLLSIISEWICFLNWI